MGSIILVWKGHRYLVTLRVLAGGVPRVLLTSGAKCEWGHFCEAGGQCSGSQVAECAEPWVCQPTPSGARQFPGVAGRGWRWGLTKNSLCPGMLGPPAMGRSEPDRGDSHPGHEVRVTVWPVHRRLPSCAAHPRPLAGHQVRVALLGTPGSGGVCVHPHVLGWEAAGHG